MIHEPRIETAYDLFMAEVITAWADDRFYVNGRWLGDKAGAPRPATIHYAAGGQVFGSGPLFEIEPATLNPAGPAP